MSAPTNDSISSGNDRKDLVFLGLALLLGSVPVIVAWVMDYKSLQGMSTLLVSIAVLLFACEPIISSGDPGKATFSKGAKWCAIVAGAAGFVGALISLS